MNDKPFRSNIEQLTLDDNNNISLIGCGGTGSHIACGLARIVHTLESLGDTKTRSLTFYDPDTITPANCGRQLFSPAECGLGKAEALRMRINMAYPGMRIYARNEKFEDPSYARNHIVIIAVDSGKSRRGIYEALKETTTQGCYNFVIDCGNTDKVGQVILGENPDFQPQDGSGEALPHIKHPELIDESKDDETPSCSLAESLARQDLFINMQCATYALDMVWKLLRNAKLEYTEAFFNMTKGSTRAKAKTIEMPALKLNKTIMPETMKAA